MMGSSPMQPKSRRWQARLIVLVSLLVVGLIYVGSYFLMCGARYFEVCTTQHWRTASGDWQVTGSVGPVFHDSSDPLPLSEITDTYNCSNHVIVCRTDGAAHLARVAFYPLIALHDAWLNAE